MSIELAIARSLLELARDEFISGLLEDRRYSERKSPFSLPLHQQFMGKTPIAFALIYWQVVINSSIYKNNVIKTDTKHPFLADLARILYG